MVGSDTGSQLSYPCLSSQTLTLITHCTVFPPLFLLTLPPFRFGVTLRRLARRRQQRFVLVIVNPAINIYIVCLHQYISVIYLFFLNHFYPSYSELFYKMLHSTQLKFISMLYLGPAVTLGLYVMSRVG